MAKEGQASGDGRDVRDLQLRAAAFVWEFAAPCFGPAGAFKLVDQDPPVVLRSGASALRECDPGPAVAAYTRLAAQVQAHAGDQATTAVLLAARLVLEAGRAMGAGARAHDVLSGYALARRQAKAWLAAASRPAADPLEAVHPAPAARATVWDGLRAMGPVVDLDAVDIQVRAGTEWAWLPGVAWPGKPHRHALPGREERLVILDGSWRPPPRHDGMQARLRDPAGLAALRAAEADGVSAAVADLRRRGVGLLAASGSLGELADACDAAGIGAWPNVPRAAVDRLVRATGAKAAPKLAECVAGRGRLLRDGRHWSLAGEGPAWTLLAPAANPTVQALARDDGERLLRAAGVALRDPRVLPGAGRWQRDVAASLRRAAPAAPGRSGLGVEAAAQAFVALASALVRNQGKDPLATTDAGACVDLAAAVNLAVDGAFEAAVGLLRVDGAYARRPSGAAALRGGLGPSGPASGMPGDIPPLM